MKIRGITPLWRAFSRATAAAPQGLPLYRPPTSHRPAADAIGSRRFSFAARSMGLERLIRPEVLPAPSLAVAVPTSRCGAAVANSFRSFSTASRQGLIMPEPTIIKPYTTIVQPATPTGLILPHSTSFWGGEQEPIQEEPRLPVLTQLSFHEPEDIELTTWEDPVSYMRRTLIVDSVQNCLIDRYDGKPLMMQEKGQKLWRSAIKLVSQNRRRGYCIARALVEDNLLVSTLHGTFRLKKPDADDISGKERSDFMGFKQVKRLFESLMKEVYGPDVIADLSLDIPHLLSVLDAAALHEMLAYYHAALLTPEGRAWLSIKLASIFRDDIIKSEGRAAVPKVQAIYEELGYLGVGIDAMHPFFAELHELHGTDVKEKMSQGKQQQQQVVLDLAFEDQENIDIKAAGYWLVTINRNGAMHPFSNKLSALVKAQNYTRSDVIKLLKYKLPLYLPVAQAICRSKKYWKWLDMRSCYPEEVTYEE